ncbi:MAG: DUF5106 domain-containing protein [Muribaculaceae bacterium]|nr:DUF5106 domain-containing protein [Muribaculaceae bacterium]
MAETTQEQPGLVMPAIPATLTEPESRAAWLAVHFWDSLDFADTRQSLDTALMEQAFADFTSVIALVDSATRTVAADTMLSRALRASDDVYLYAASVADKYLFDPESPLYSEALYEPFASFAAAGAPDAFAAGEKLEIIATNRPGRLVPDFAMLTADGRRVRLSDYRGRHVMLFFYEPGCPTCHDLMERIASQGVPEGMDIVALYPGNDVTAWQEHIGDFPEGWTVARDADGAIDRRRILSVRSTPTVFIISPTGTIQ